MSWRRRIFAGCIALGLAIALVYFLQPEPVRVQVAPVVRGVFQQTVSDDGKTRVREQYIVSAPIAGISSRITLKPGDAVERGTALVTLVPNLAPMLDRRTRQELEQRLGVAEAERSRAAAAVERARATQQQATIDLERSRILFSKSVVALNRVERDELAFKLSVRELEVAEFQFHVAEHSVDLARVALSAVTLVQDSSSEPERIVITSPVSGRILRVRHESEGSVGIGEPILELADPADLEVVVDVLTTDAVEIKPGAHASIEHWGGSRILVAAVRRVEPGGFTKVSALGVEEQRVNVILDIVSPRDDWKELGDAFRVDASIVVFELADAVKVPTSALFREQDNWKLFVVAADVARERAVKVIRRGGLESAISTGVEPGEQVIIYPPAGLREGARVTITPGGGK